MSNCRAAPSSAVTRPRAPRTRRTETNSSCFASLAPLCSTQRAPRRSHSSVESTARLGKEHDVQRHHVRVGVDVRVRTRVPRRRARARRIFVAPLAASPSFRAEDENSGAEGGGEAPARAPAVAVAVVAAVAASAAAGKTMECRNPSCKFLA